LRRILVVCTANMCRSPMAEALLGRSLLKIDPHRAVLLSSAGTGRYEGAPATIEAVMVMHGRNLDISRHVSRTITAEMVFGADLILTMTRAHQFQILKRFPHSRDKVFVFREYARYGPKANADGTGMSSWDVADPVGRDLSRYEICARELEHSSRELAFRLCSAVDIQLVAAEGG